MSNAILENLKSSSPEIMLRGISIVLIIVGVLFAKRITYSLIKKALQKIEDDDPSVNIKEQRARTLADIAKSTVNIILYLIAGIMVLSELGINITPILTGAGVLGLAVGFGTQTLVKDMVTGFFILLEGQFNKGDRVEIGGITGVIKEMRLRTTIIKGEDGEIYIIPNSQITKVTRFPRTSKKR